MVYKNPSVLCVSCSHVHVTLHHMEPDCEHLQRYQPAEWVDDQDDSCLRKVGMIFIAYKRILTRLATPQPQTDLPVGVQRN